MVKLNHKVITLLFLLLVLLLFSCAKQTPIVEQSEGLPNIESLEERIQALYKAEQNNEWDKWYNFLMPEYKIKNGKEKFVQQYSKPREVEIVSWEIITITQADHSNKPKEITSAVAVSMDVSVKRNGIITKEKDQTDYWVFQDNEWYWSWRGWPYD